jgi:hypothetical protein
MAIFPFSYLKKISPKNRDVLAGILLLFVTAFISGYYVAHKMKTPPLPPPDAYVDPELKPYVQDFVELAWKHGIRVDKQAKKMSVQLTDLRYLDFKRKNGKWFRPAGWCFIFENIVGISRSYWNKIDDVDRTILINHELGHCLLGRVHEEPEAKDPISSIMEPELIDEDEYLDNQDYYDEELFSPETFNKLADKMTNEGSIIQKFKRVPPVLDLTPHLDTKQSH